MTKNASHLLMNHDLCQDERDVLVSHDEHDHLRMTMMLAWLQHDHLMMHRDYLTPLSTCSRERLAILSRLFSRSSHDPITILTHDLLSIFSPRSSHTTLSTRSPQRDPLQQDPLNNILSTRSSQQDPLTRSSHDYLNKILSHDPSQEYINKILSGIISSNVYLMMATKQQGPQAKQLPRLHHRHPLVAPAPPPCPPPSPPPPPPPCPHSPLRQRERFESWGPAAPPHREADPRPCKPCPAG